MRLFAVLMYALVGLTGFEVSRGFTVRRAETKPLPNRVYLFTDEQHCAPCVKIKKETLKELAKRGVKIGVANGNDIQVIDVTVPDNKAWEKAFEITSIPTWVRIQKNLVTGTKGGFMSADEYVEWVKPPAN